MEYEHIEGYIYHKRHDFNVDVTNVEYGSDKHIHIYAWIVSNNPPQFTFITNNHIERGMVKPSSQAIVDTDGNTHLKHNNSKWFRAANKDKVICDALVRAHNEWIIEEMLIGGNYEIQ